MKEFSIGTMYWINYLAPQEEMDSDFAEMRKNGFTLVRLIAWWEQTEPRRGQFDFSHLDRAFLAAEKNQIRLMPTIGFYPPLWFADELKNAGMNEPGRYMTFMRPEVRRPLSAWLGKLIPRYKDSPALAFWNVWNEPTLNDTVTPFRLERFAAWLNAEYRTIESLKKTWRGEYPVCSLLCPESMEELTGKWLENAFQLGVNGRNAVIRCDWYRFLTEELNSEIQFFCDEVRRYDRIHPTHANMDGLTSNSIGRGRNCYAATKKLDTVSCSIHASHDYRGGTNYMVRSWNYSFCAAQCRSWDKDGKHSMVGELQAGTTESHPTRYTPSPKELTYELSDALAEGLDGVIFWEWQSWRAGTFEIGEFSLRNPSDGGPTPRSEAVRVFAENYRKHRDFLDTVKRPRSQVAIFYGQAGSIYRKVLAQDRPFNLETEEMQSLFGCYRALQEAHIAVDFLYEEEVRTGKLSQYKAVYLPMSEVIAADTAKCFADFVRNGGALYADGRSGWLDSPMFLRRVVPANGLAEVFGAVECDYTMNPESVEILCGKTRLHGSAAMQHLRSAPDAKMTGHFSDGSVAVVDHSYGKGKTRLAGSGLCFHLYHFEDPKTSAWIASFALQSGVVPEAELPKDIQCKRLIGPDGELWMLHNHGKNVCNVTLPDSKTIIAFNGKTRLSRYLTMQADETQIMIVK